MPPLSGTALGILWPMNDRPGWVGSSTILAVVLPVAGVAGSVLAARPRGKGSGAVARLAGGRP
jgi:hypothetical protein